MGIKFEDEILGLLLLNSLLESWETFKVSITYSSPNGVVSLQMAKGSILNEEMRRHKVLHLSLRCLSLKIGGEVSKKNKMEEEKRVEVSLSLDTRMWSVITVTQQGICRSIVSCEKMITNAKKIIDSSATLHVTPRNEFFTSCTSGDFRVLKMGNDGVINVGDVCLQTNMGVQL
ncbi:hypothetical protein CR513_52187, partial [Mucuna pruriens]